MIKLKVPAKGVTQTVTVVDPETKKEKSEKIQLEFVSQGNFSAELTPKGIVETSSRRFADWLISEHGLKEIKESDAAETGSESDTQPAETTEENTEGGEN